MSFTMAGVSWLGFTTVVVLGLVTLPVGTLGSQVVDMARPDCPSSAVRVLDAENQVYILTANYTPTQQATLKVCNTTIYASHNNQQLHFSVEKLSIKNCGVSVLIYDDPLDLNPTRTLTCEDSVNLPIHGSTTHGVIKFSILKHAQNGPVPPFQFKIQVSGAQGPSRYAKIGETPFFAALVGAEDETQTPDNPTPANNETESGGMNIGVVIGIAIAGVILLVALIGIAIYCCLRNRAEEMKDYEADARSDPSVFTSGTSQVMFPSNNHRKGKYGSTEDVRSSSSSNDRANNIYSNKGYHADADERNFERRESYRREKAEKGGHENVAFDEADHTKERGGHVSRKDSGRGSGRVVKYDKKKNYSRNEEYEMSKVSKMPNGILKPSRSKSPNRSQSSTEGSTIDSNALVYGYSQTTHAHPNTQHIPVLERTRSRSRSRGPGSHRSASTGRSRSGSVGKSAGKDMSKAPKGARQYNDMSHFLEKPKRDNHRPRSRSGSVGRRARSDSRTSENVPSEVSFAPSGASSKKTGGKRVHIQGVESDI